MKRFTLSLCLIATLVLGAGISVTKPFSNKDFSWLLKDSSQDTITGSQNGIGWADGKLTIQASGGGSLQLYRTGDPAEDVIYWPGRFTVASLEAASITGSITGSIVDNGSIPNNVMNASMPAPFSGFVNDSSHAGSIGGLTYANTGPNSANEPATPGTYFAAFEVTDGGTDTVNALEGRIKTFAQMGVPKLVTAPSTASSAGTAGQVAYDTSYFYVCTATNTWKRTALSTW
jgi:hypothetical protein